MDRALSEGRLVAGVSYDIPGIGYQDTWTGRIDSFDPKSFGIGVNKGRQSLVDRLNPAIEELKTSGKIDAMMTENLASLGATPA